MGKSKKKKKKPGSNHAITIAAIFISFCALTVSIYQSVILYNQQYAAVWPYVSPQVSYTESTFDFSIQNKGTGPAIIKELHLTLDGKPVTDYQVFTEDLLQVNQFYSVSFNTPDNTVIATGEKVQIIRVTLPDSLRISTTNFVQRTTVEICYCSIFGDCWWYNDGEVKSKRRCGD